MRCPNCGHEINPAAELGRAGRGKAKRRTTEHYRRMAQLSAAKRRANKEKRTFSLDS